MEWESRPDGSVEGRAGGLLFRLSPEMLRRREIGVWQLRVYRLIPLEPAPQFGGLLEGQAAARQLAGAAEGLDDSGIGDLLSRLMPG